MSASVPGYRLEDLRRWIGFGGTWEVLRRGPDGVLLSLCRCDGGEEVERVTSDDPALRAFVDAEGEQHIPQP